MKRIALLLAGLAGLGVGLAIGACFRASRELEIAVEEAQPNG